MLKICFFLNLTLIPDRSFKTENLGAWRCTLLRITPLLLGERLDLGLAL